MHVEECCLALLNYVLPEIDRNRKGLCIDIGVGTFAFYFEIFARTGFATVAIEPLPIPAVTKICRLLGIKLVTSCIYDNDGTQTMYTGTYSGAENLNLSSIRSDWWGSSANSIQVRSMTLDTLLKSVDAKIITCLKIDVEGVESVIIKQLKSINASLLPAVIVFEYGGGGAMHDGKGGWSEEGINETLSCFSMLQKLGYRTTIVIDSMPDSRERVIDLAEVDMSPDILFNPRSIYGNAICFRDRVSDETWIETICSLYRDNDITPPKPLPAISRFASFTWRICHAIRRCI